MKEEMTQDAVQENGTLVEGRNAVLEAFRSGKTIDKLYVLDGCKDGPVQTIVREARKHDTIINFVAKERLDQLSATGHHQGVIAQASAYEYATVEDILENARKKGEPPFIFLLDGIEDPHNLGADHPYCESGRRPRCDHSETPGSWIDCNSGKNFRRCVELYAGCESDQLKYCDGGAEERGAVVRLCRYGGRDHVPSESDRSDRSGDRQ